MGQRVAWPCLVVWCLGCQSLLPGQSTDENGPARQLWQKGQASLRQGLAPEAIQQFQQSLQLDPGLDCNHLSLAAAYMEIGAEESARPHLEKYCAAHPDQLAVRGHLAELLLRLHRPLDARREFEQFAAGLQDE